MLDALPSIAEAARLLREGQIHPLDLVEYCLARIRCFEDRVHAWVMVDEKGARKEAMRQHEALRNGHDLGPLAGMPIGIKDIIDVAGWPTQAGSPLRENHVATRDAMLVKRLRDAGAIILGKTVTTQFACFDPPPTRNPWNLLRTPGGSSSGSAAAVALEMCMAAIGTQTGGSIVRPASYCGVVGLKPTLGHVPLDGVVPVSCHLDHAGPIARSVSDAAIVYKQIRDAKPLAVRSEATPCLRVLKHFLDEAAPSVQAVTHTALEKLVDHDLQDRTLELPAWFSDIPASHKCIMAVDAAEVHQRAYAASPHAFAKEISSLLEMGLGVRAVDYAAALQFQRFVQREISQIFGPNSIAIMPSTNTTAPGFETTGDPKFNSPWSFAGVPSITIPAGLNEQGLPCGLQLVGACNSEELLLQAAQRCEQRLNFHKCGTALRAHTFSFHFSAIPGEL